MSNPLTDIIPAEARRVVYATYAGVGVAIGATQVGYTAASVDQPTWLIVAFAVYGYLGVALGLVAAANTDTPADPPAPGR